MRKLKKIINEDLFDVLPWSYNPAVGLSTGIRMIMKDNLEFEKDIKDALKNFLNNNWGTFYGYSECPTEGREYGEYKTCIGKNIYIHRELIDFLTYELVIYFDFER